MVFTFWLLFSPQRQHLESILIQDKIVSEIVRKKIQKLNSPALTWFWISSQYFCPMALWLLLKCLQCWGTQYHLSVPFHSWTSLLVIFISKLYWSLSNFYTCPKSCTLGWKLKTPQTWEDCLADVITFLPTLKSSLFRLNIFRLLEPSSKEVNSGLFTVFHFLQRRPSVFPTTHNFLCTLIQVTLNHVWCPCTDCSLILSLFRVISSVWNALRPFSWLTNSYSPCRTPA